MIFNFNSFGQLHSSVVVLKSGDTLKGLIGKLKTKTFIYKKYSKDSRKEINFSQIESLKIRYSKNDIKEYRFFEIKDKNGFIAVRPSVIGTKAELYFIEKFEGFGGTNNYSIILEYYIKKSGEKKLTHLGKYDLLGTMRKNVLKYFTDCFSLIEKVKIREFRMKNGLEEIVNYYNGKCE